MSKQGHLEIGPDDDDYVTRENPYPVALYDQFGNPTGSLTPIVNSYLHQHSISNSLAVATVGGGTENTIELADATGFSAGNEIRIGAGRTDITFPVIKSIATNVLTLDRFIDAAHAIGTEVDLVTTAMNIDGSSTPEIFISEPPGTDIWHVTRILISMTHSTAGDLGLFGNLAELTNGVQFRVKVSDQFVTFTNWKSSGDMALDMFDLEFDVRSGGGGAYGTSGRGDFSAIGTGVRLNAANGDKLEMIVQDNLTALSTFRIKAQGHLEGQ